MDYYTRNPPKNPSGAPFKNSLSSIQTISHRPTGVHHHAIVFFDEMPESSRPED